MRLTTKTRYGIRALYDVAFHRRGQATQAKEIAERQQIPLRYLEQILQDFRHAGLVEARRGPHGGYALARPAAQIRLGDVLRALQGPLESLFALTDEEGEGAPARSRRTRSRSTRARAPASPGVDVPALLWADTVARLIEVLDATTLQDFVDRAESVGAKRAVQQPQMYFI